MAAGRILKSLDSIKSHNQSIFDISFHTVVVGSGVVKLAVQLIKLSSSIQFS